MSAATIDRRLEPFREGVNRRRRAPPSAAVKATVPIRTFSDWDDPAPRFFEADLVAHSGPSAHGRFIQTLTLTDIASGWTETAPLLFREQGLLTQVLSKMQRSLPRPLLGLDTDNDTVFMNETVQGWCAAQISPSRDRDRIERTTKPKSSRRTAPSSARWSVTDDTRALIQLPSSASFTQPCVYT